MQRALHVPGFEQLSVVDVSLSLQSDAESQRTAQALFEHDDNEVPGFRQVSVVDEFESAQSLSELHAKVELLFESPLDIAVCVQEDEVVPGLEQASVVRELLSLHSESELQVIVPEPARLMQLLLQPPALLQLSSVEGLLSLQLLSAMQDMLQLPVVFTTNNAALPEL